jgi:hypothetical protein
MATRFVEFERNKLYEQVWSQTVVQVAESYRVRSAEVKRAAEALAVPMPPAGHWTKVAHNKGVARPPLPDFAGKTTHRHTWWVNDEAEEVERRFTREREKIVASASELPEMRKAVADCVPIVKKMGARLKKAYKDTRNWPNIRGSGLFEVSVSPQNQERALLTFDRIVRYCQASGLKVISDETKREPASFLVEDVSFTMRIFESGRREERELTVAEKAKAKSDPYFYVPDRFIFHPSNLLRLEVQRPDYRSTEFTVQDGSEQPLADRIHDVPLQLRECALKHQLREVLRAEERKREEARRDEHRKKVERKSKELEKLKQYEEAADQLARARRLRELAAALESSGKLAPSEAPEKLEWIHNAADWLDPTVGMHWPVVDDI